MEKRKGYFRKMREENPNIKRGICNTPEMKALREEEKKKYFEILEKYKK